ncbi:Hypothetical predicted protein [Xyrichtys novacula]|uniref:Uncharacterized protein n=1 Tax=Xyrichtys novacula TaxID=13765 RepID=A0AAV1GIJ8_XYRNO|nr:Hypothetical predicted protein [Xyrichtys novacula]
MYFRDDPTYRTLTEEQKHLNEEHLRISTSEPSLHRYGARIDPVGCCHFDGLYGTWCPRKSPSIIIRGHTENFRPPWSTKAGRRVSHSGEHHSGWLRSHKTMHGDT